MNLSVIDEWIKCVCVYVCVCNTHNRILLIYKKNEVLPFLRTWMTLDGIMLSEISQTEKKIFHL